MKIFAYGIVGAAVFLVSAVIGLVAGVRGITLILRALGWGIVMGGLSFGAVTVMKMFLPELFTNGAPKSSKEIGESSGEEEVQAGEQVNIVVDDEPVENQFASMVDGVDEEDSSERSRSPSAIPSIVEEVVETAVDSDDYQKPVVEESTEIEGVDELPDIGSFAGNFSSGSSSDEDFEEDDEYSDVPSSRSGGTSSGGNGGDAGNDPAAIAKALQTMLKKD